MRIRNARLLSGMAISAALLSGCVQPIAQNNSSADQQSEIVTPWGTTVAAPSSQGTAKSGQNGQSALVTAPKPAITDMQRQQIDEARIALDILDRMAQRCVQQNDPAACNTLQTNWPTLSQQLHKSLAVITGNNMTGMSSSGAPMMNDPIISPTASSAKNPPQSPAQNPAQSNTIPGTDGAPTMEKVIPMTSQPSDG